MALRLLPTTGKGKPPTAEAPKAGLKRVPRTCLNLYTVNVDTPKCQRQPGKCSLAGLHRVQPGRRHGGYCRRLSTHASRLTCVALLRAGLEDEAGGRLSACATTQFRELHPCGVAHIYTRASAAGS
jgi:hypothetical protein